MRVIGVIRKGGNMTNTETKPRCCRCNLLESKDFPGGLKGRVENTAYRCSAGKYDVTDRIDGGKIPRYFSWGGIAKPNKTVAATQKDCQEFEEGTPR